MYNKVSIYHPSLSDFSLSDIKFLLQYASLKMLVVITNLGSVSYLVKGRRYSYEMAVKLFNESVNLSNKAKNLKGLQKATDNFLKNCYREIGRASCRERVYVLV